MENPIGTAKQGNAEAVVAHAPYQKGNATDQWWETFLSLLLTHSFAHVYHCVLELLHGNLAIFVSIENFECVDYVLKGVWVLSTFSDQTF